ncbi:hypothetical protein V6R21_22705 [Limibacter armeniacum]|uniref:hypothetical protein n=1 Tax=Limibacter armeniacum TaxID=466084 RepID=UPI002FE5FC1E
MKKTYILTGLMFGAIAMTSCDPNKDINELLEQEQANQASKDSAAHYRDMAAEAYRVTSSDYSSLFNLVSGSDTTTAKEIKTMGGFETEAQAENFLPLLINDKLTGQVGNVLEVTYDLYVDKAPFQLVPIKRAYTLSDSDYDLVGNGYYDNFDIRDGKSESNSVVIHEKVAEILENKRSGRKIGASLEGDIVEVTYKVFNDDYETLEVTAVFRFDGTDSWTSELMFETYRLTDTDYEQVGNGTYGNFDVRDGKPEEDPAVIDQKIDTILKTQFTDAVAGDQRNVEYEVYNGSNVTLATVYEFDGTDWSKINVSIADETQGIEFTVAMYDAMGAPGNYDNFSSSDAPEYYIPIYLAKTFPYAKAGDTETFRYYYYTGSGSEYRTSQFEFNGTDWVMSAINEEKEIFFVFKETNPSKEEWIIAPQMVFTEVSNVEASIEYTLNDSDYSVVGNGRYGNFDTRDGKAEADRSVIIEKITTILNVSLAGQVPEGAIVAVTYKYYDGANGEATILLEASL